MQKKLKRVWLHYNKTLWTLNLNFNIKTKTVEIYLLVFSTLEKCNPILSFQAVQQAAGWTWSTVRSWLTLT